MTRRTAREWVKEHYGELPYKIRLASEKNQEYLVSAWFREMADALEGK